MKKVIFALLLFIPMFSFAQKANGIIIADETKQTVLFNSDSAEIIRFADSISSKYNKVIIHLGRSFVFRRGNIFTSPKSQKNLQLFCKELKKNNLKVYLWQLDSYGGASFYKLYQKHQDIITENMGIVDSLQILYDGVVVDLEWINDSDYENSDRFLELMKFFRSKIGDKELMYFASLIDCHEENCERGYKISKLPEINAFPIVMLYPTDGGFQIQNNKLVPKMFDERIDELKLFHKNNGWEVAVNLSYDYYTNIKNKAVKLSKVEVDKLSLIDLSEPVKSKDYKNYSISNFKLIKDIVITAYSGEMIKLEKGNIIFKFDVSQNILDNNYYIYEYFNLNKNEIK